MEITELALKHFALAPTQFDRWLEILTDDIVMELPYGPSAGFSERMAGKRSIGAEMPPYFARLPGLTFDHPLVFPLQNADEAFAMYDIDRVVANSGRRYQQNYVCHFRKRGDQLCYIAEWFDTVRAVQALGK